MKITRSELLYVVYRFYPRGMHCYARIHVPPNEPVCGVPNVGSALLEIVDGSRDCASFARAPQGEVCPAPRFRGRRRLGRIPFVLERWVV